MKIYTKTGDDGTTSLCNDVRVPKDDIRIEVNGQIDELDSLLGAVVSFISAGDGDSRSAAYSEGVDAYHGGCSLRTGRKKP